ncbi:MAG: hypothetical protein FJW39_23900 [Acidobacteria bacterium]|nr:hypothetical protein [Acidobacteriota bacterium]
MDRLNKLEQENDALRRQLQDLRGEVEKLRSERVELVERRVDEQAQTKVESSQKLPVKLTGMLLANLYRNGRQSNGVDHATSAARIPGRAASGLTVRQSVIGLDYTGSPTFLGGTVGGHLTLDFFEGNAEINQFPPVRMRTATVQVDWKTRSLFIGQDKPLFSPRDPNTFSFSGVAPLTASGNLWRWQPQIRLEQRPQIGQSRISGQVGVIQTFEDATTGANVAFERKRPGLEGRLEFGYDFDGDRRIEIAPGFHFSESHINGFQIPSKLASVDWFANPWSKLEFTGLLWRGQNIQHFGALRQGVTVLSPTRIMAVRSKGGWAQASFPFHPRLTFNAFGGIHDDRNRDLLLNNVAVNRTGALNFMYRMAPNVIVTIEGMQIRTTYIGSGNRKNNRYDLSVAYLF